MQDERLLELVRRMRDALAAFDVDQMGGLVSADYVEDYPQSRERVRGVAGLRRLLAEHPQPPRLLDEPRLTIVGEESVAVEELALYGDERWWIIALFGVRDSLVASERAYYGRPLERAAWRAAWTVPIPNEEPSPDPGGHRSVERDVAEHYFRAQAESDFATLEAMRHERFVHDMPQSGERFPSAQAYAEAHRHYPGGLPSVRPIGLSGPRDTWVVGASPVPLRVSGRGRHWVGEAELVYPSGERWFEVLFMDFAGGKVLAERSYWAEPFDPPAWREGLTERY